jgi:tryptophan-rich sensory protein
MAETTALSRDWWKLALLTVPAIVLAGSASGWLSGSGYGNPWFDGLTKPPFMPPGWVFGAAWTTLYTLMGVALARVLASPPSDRRRKGVTLFFVQLALNFAWSPIFFAAHDIGLATIVIFVMLAIASAATAQFLRIDRVAGALMLPYLAWLCFAAALTTAIDRLNPGAGSPLFG